MRRVFLLFHLIVLFLACSNGSKEDVTTEPVQQVFEGKSLTTFGNSITAICRPMKPIS
ncbi:hypothetical protein [Niabella aquatica]